MKEFTYVIKEELGLHARPAGLLVKEAKKFQSATTLAAKGKTAAAGKLIRSRVRMRMLRSRHSRSSSRKICNSSIDIESEGTGNGKIHRKVRL